jgi:twitching motility protein PilU
MQLSLNLRGIISQRLIPSVTSLRVPALEILIDTPRIKDLIKAGKIDHLLEAMESAINEGCQTFEHALFRLYKERTITVEQALANSDNPNNLRLKIKLDGSKGDDELENLIGGKELGERALRIKGVDGSIATSFRKL